MHMPFENDRRTDSDSKILERHLRRLDIFKLGLRNSFGIDFRTATRLVHVEDGEKRSERFHYLGEVFPFIESKVNALQPMRRRAYETLKERAVESFWQIYSDFQPLMQSIANSSGVDADRLTPVLGRATLLFDVSRGSKWVTYLEKSLRESVKNLRGEQYARELGLPLSAGRLVPQIRWVLEQAAMQKNRALSADESDSVVINFLSAHRSKFSLNSMRRTAEIMRDGHRNVSLDAFHKWMEPSGGGRFDDERFGARDAGNDCHLDRIDECEFQLKQIHAAIRLAGFDADETCIVLQRLDLPYDQPRYDKVASKVTSASLRKRSTRLLVRLMAAKFAPQAPRFGSLFRSTSSDAREGLVEKIAACADERGRSPATLIDELLNWMSLSRSIYRVSISERGRLVEYCSNAAGTAPASATFDKFRAALIEQERLGFLCWEPSGEEFDSP